MCIWANTVVYLSVNLKLPEKFALERPVFSLQFYIWLVFGNYSFVAPIPSRTFFEESVYQKVKGVTEDCKEESEAGVLPHEIWDTNTGEQTGTITSHAGGSFKES